MNTPTPLIIKAERVKYKHTQTEAAEKVFVTLRAWQNWEAGDRKMHPALFMLYKLRARFNV